MRKLITDKADTPPAENAGDRLPRRRVAEEGRSRRLRTPDPFLRSTDRCSHVAVRRLPGNARRLQRQTLASTHGAADVCSFAITSSKIVCCNFYEGLFLKAGWRWLIEVRNQKKLRDLQSKKNQ